MAGEKRSQAEGEFRSRARRMTLGLVIGGVLIAAEAAAGFLTHSLALISDAGHNTADLLAVGLSLFAVYVMEREPNERKTFGYGRVGILTALANSVALVAVAGVLIYESIRRMADIEPVSGGTVALVSLAALVINGVTALLLFSHRRDLNIRSAFLHMASDAGVSLSVLVAGLVIIFTDWYYADPLIAIIISLFIVYTAWQIVREAVDILLESVPRGISLNDVEEAMLSVSGIDAVHHLHVWEIGSGVYALSCHVEVEDRHLSDCAGILTSVAEVLRERFKIIHPTIQVECGKACPCEVGGDSAKTADGEGPRT